MRVNHANVKSQDINTGKKTSETSVSVGTESAKLSIYDSEITSKKGVKYERSGIKGSISVPDQNGGEHNFQLDIYQSSKP